MNDPHVVSLTYQMKVGSSIRFNSPPALERDYDAFHFRLDAGTLVMTMKTHFATSDDARLMVEPILRAWEIGTGLTCGPDAMSFSFATAEIIDRSPPPPGSVSFGVSPGHFGIAFGGSVGDIMTYSKYLEPPSNFSATEDVQVMWFRWTQYLAGKEPLLSMAYAVLSLLEGTTGQKHGARVAVCAKYSIDQAVRENLGGLVSEKGSPHEARKLDFGATQQPLTYAEKRWIEAVVKALIRRKAEYDADPTAALASITLSDFPAI